MKINSEEHRKGLIELYKNQMTGETPYMKAVLRKALLEINAGTKPRKVENFVVKMEKLMRKRI